MQSAADQREGLLQGHFGLYYQVSKVSKYGSKAIFGAQSFSTGDNSSQA